MEISEEQLRISLANPDNLANLMRNGKIIPQYTKEDFENATITESGISIAASKEKTSFDQTEESGSERPLPTNVEHISPLQHRELRRPGNCRPWLSKQERTGIKIATTSGGKTQTEVAREYGVQVSTISDITNDKRRVSDSPRSADQKSVDEELDKVREAAIDRLMAGLGHLTPEKMSGHNAKDISIICKNMSGVVRDTIPDRAQPQSINLVVYAPELKNEKTYDVVEI